MITAEEARNLKNIKKIEIVADALNRINEKIIEATITTNTAGIELTTAEVMYKDDIIKELNLKGFNANIVTGYIRKSNTIIVEW